VLQRVGFKINNCQVRDVEDVTWNIVVSRVGEGYVMKQNPIAQNVRAFTPCSWEIYGDWTDDTTKLETQVVYLLR
jgi:hypothetical protein